MFDEEITLHLQSRWAFLKQLLRAIMIDSFRIGIEEAQLKMLLVKTVAHRSHGKTKKPRQNQEATAKQKAMTKPKRRQQKTATVK